MCETSGFLNRRHGPFATKNEHEFFVCVYLCIVVFGISHFDSNYVLNMFEDG